MILLRKYFSPLLIILIVTNFLLNKWRKNVNNDILNIKSQLSSMNEQSNILQLEMKKMQDIIKARTEVEKTYVDIFNKNLTPVSEDDFTILLMDVSRETGIKFGSPKIVFDAPSEKGHLFLKSVDFSITVKSQWNEIFSKIQKEMEFMNALKTINSIRIYPQGDEVSADVAGEIFFSEGNW